MTASQRKGRRNLVLGQFEKSNRGQRALVRLPDNRTRGAEVKSGRSCGLVSVPRVGQEI